MRYFFLSLAFCVLLVVALAGWRGHIFHRPPLEMFSDMVRQPKVDAEVPSGFFADGRAARAPVAATIPLGYNFPVYHSASEAAPPIDRTAFSSGSDYLNTGKFGAAWGAGMPFTITPAIMQRGREQFNIFCSACHGATGAGDGIAHAFGLMTVQSLLPERLRQMADGEIFNTVTYGKNTMFGLGDRISVSDRWAVIAYLRALQKSQGGATANDLPPAERSRLKIP